MKKSLIIFSLFIITLSLQAQRDTVSYINRSPKKTFVREASGSNIKIFPVPVRSNSFSIRTDRDMNSVKVTNMIGQDIFRAQYKNPLSFTKVILENPKKGMYLVTIAFVDGSRVVRKIMVENPE